ncbi:MAG TPA: hypothetical protein VEI73_05755 [Candidatus Acidoferrum sp.]|nr:hypothetical protein [Candidatus Acidoferrum sp.]
MDCSRVAFAVEPHQTLKLGQQGHVTSAFALKQLLNDLAHTARIQQAID